jgi:hypothetical protein
VHSLYGSWDVDVDVEGGEGVLEALTEKTTFKPVLAKGSEFACQMVHCQRVRNNSSKLVLLLFS